MDQPAEIITLESDDDGVGLEFNQVPLFHKQATWLEEKKRPNQDQTSPNKESKTVFI